MKFGLTAAAGITLSIRRRILVLATVSGLGVAAIGGIAWIGQRQLDGFVTEAESYASLARRAAELKADIFGLRDAASDLSVDRSGPLIDLFQKRFDQTTADLGRLRDLAAAADAAAKIDAIDKRLGEIRALFDPLVKSYRRLGTTQNDGLNEAIRSAAMAMEAVVRAKILGGGGEAEYRLGYALASARLTERRYMADHDQELLGEIETAAGRLERAIGRAELDDADKKAMTEGFDRYRTALAAWVDEDRAAFTTFEKLIGIFDLIAPVLDEVTAVGADGQAHSRDALAEARAANARLIGVAAIVVLFAGVFVSLMVGRSIAGPLDRLRRSMESLAAGDLDSAVPEVTRRDELGDMARAVLVFRDAGIERRRLAADQSRHAEGQIERGRAIERMVVDFNTGAAAAIAEVSGAAERLAAAAGTMDRAVGAAAGNARNAGEAVDEATGRIGHASETTREIAQSIAEVANRAQQSTAVAQTAVDRSRRTAESMRAFAEAAGRIGEVVDLIRTIAGQTNLLALNATIEAARAGEAGRGFAIVAQEVKQLAGQTQQATEEIAKQIDAIRASSDDVVGAIRVVDDTIGEMAELATAVAAAVEEQNAAIGAMSDHMTQAADVAGRGAAAIGGAGAAAESAAATTSEVANLAAGLRNEADRLSREIDRFVGAIRAA